MLKELRPAEATAIRDIISGLQGAMKHLSTLTTATAGLAGALGVWEPGVRSSLLYLSGTLMLLGALGTSLSALVLLPLMHASIPDPGRSFVRDNKGTLAVVLIAVGMFSVGLCLVMFSISSSNRSQSPRISAAILAPHANPPLQPTGFAGG